MSELKAYIGPAPDEKGLADYYLKSEADKVIAEKDAYIAELKNYADEVNKDFELVDNQNERLLKIVLHQKHKRCLTMARWCAACRFAWSFMPDDDEIKAECKFYEKWKRRWEELAEEPTWAKFLQLIHKEGK